MFICFNKNVVSVSDLEISEQILFNFLIKLLNQRGEREKKLFFNQFDLIGRFGISRFLKILFFDNPTKALVRLWGSVIWTNQLIRNKKSLFFLKHDYFLNS